MEYLVTASEMKEYDKNTIEHFKVPSLVLMERAAQAVAQVILERNERISALMEPSMSGLKNRKVLIVAGCGNNGGDGFAVGRLLLQEGYSVDFLLVGEREKCSEETARQIEIIEAYGGVVMQAFPQAEYDIIVDALFGIGLSRPLTGKYLEAVEAIEAQNAWVISVDIPSGIHADTGAVMSAAVHADVTVCFAYKKAGCVFYPGAAYAGKILTAQIGITQDSFLGKEPKYFTLTDKVSMLLPPRDPDGNKGTFGKVLLIAGSSGMSGAATLSGNAVFAAGAGMLKIFTEKENKVILQQTLPEAMVTIYDEQSVADNSLEEKLLADCEWADVIAIGPGLGQKETAFRLLKYVIEKTKKPLIIDADGLNLLGKHRELLEELIIFQKDQKTYRELILTPHPAEAARLAGCSTDRVKQDPAGFAGNWAEKLQAAFVCKGSRTVIGFPNGRIFVNQSGNSGMATAGSGDVLTGLIAGLLAQEREAFSAAVTGVYLHGLSGDRASHQKGEYSMKASDISAAVSELTQIQ